MEILLQGTGAADGIPSAFSRNRVSEFAREKGGLDVRTRTCALIDGHLKIDFGPDTWYQCSRDGVVAEDFSGVIFTHSHEDHFDRNELQYMLYPFTDREYLEFPLYGNGRVLELLEERYPCWPMELVPIASFQPFHHLGYLITPIKAYHKLDEDSLNLIIQREGRTFLYATDTGWWRQETWDFLAQFRIDLLVLECTEGSHRTSYYGHLDAAEAVKKVSLMRQNGMLNEGARVVTTHHSSQGQMTHGELAEALKPHGIEPGFDGMRLSV